MHTTLFRCALYLFLLVDNTPVCPPLWPHILLKLESHSFYGKLSCKVPQGRGWPHMMSAKNGGVQTPPLPLVKTNQNCSIPSPPLSEILLFCLKDPKQKKICMLNKFGTQKKKTRPGVLFIPDPFGCFFVPFFL